MMVVFHTFLISSKSSSLTLRAVHARMIAFNSSVLTSSEISPVLLSILTSMVFSFFRNTQWSSPPGFSWALCAAAVSGESPGQLVASPVDKGGFRVLLYGVRLVPAVCVLPPTRRSLIRLSGCQGGDPLRAMGSARARGP